MTSVLFMMINVSTNKAKPDSTSYNNLQRRLRRRSNSFSGAVRYSTNPSRTRMSQEATALAPPPAAVPVDLLLPSPTSENKRFPFFNRLTSKEPKMTKKKISRDESTSLMIPSLSRLVQFFVNYFFITCSITYFHLGQNTTTKITAMDLFL